MKFTFISKIALVLLGSVVSGCAGDRVLMATKTNVGLDIDSRPPTAEITIARRELAIQPTFPDIAEKKDNNGHEIKETSLPILASFNLQGNFFNPRIIAHFAGGDAAVYLAQEPAEDNRGDNKPSDSSLCLESQPEDTRGWFLKMWHSLTSTTYTKYLKEPRPFYFATDTAYGLKVAWSGTAGPYPDSLKLGYNRKEFASPPLFVDEGCASGQTGWNVKLPSFYAAIDNASALETFEEGEDNHVQFFATGQAATAFAKRASIRQLAFEGMAPEVAKREAESLNQELIGDIEKAFAADKKEEADKKRHDAILAEAVKAGLVPDGTTTDKFSNKLKANG